MDAVRAVGMGVEMAPVGWGAGPFHSMTRAHRCVWRPQVRAHGPQLLTAMIGGLDDGDDPHSLVALEAMVGLARLLDLVEAWDLRSVLLHVAIRIRPFFDSVGPASPAPGHAGLAPAPSSPGPASRVTTARSGPGPGVDGWAALGRAP